MKISQLVSSTVLLLTLGAGLACAQTATYTFDSAQWVLGTSTPLLNMAPDSASGLAGFRAGFTASPTAGGLIIGSGPLSVSFSGQYLYQPGPAVGDTLTITLNQPIRSVHLDFAQFAPGRFDLTSSAGTASIIVSAQAGILDFQGVNDFTQFSLEAFTSDNSPIPLALDNLVLGVPEPSALALLGLGTGVVAVLRRRIVP